MLVREMRAERDELRKRDVALRPQLEEERGRAAEACAAGGLRAAAEAAINIGGAWGRVERRAGRTAVFRGYHCTCLWPTGWSFLLRLISPDSLLLLACPVAAHASKLAGACHRSSPRARPRRVTACRSAWR